MKRDGYWKWIVVCLVALALLGVVSGRSVAYAATFSLWGPLEGSAAVEVFGINLTHNYVRPLNAWCNNEWYGSDNRRLKIYYELPDDGSTWFVRGLVMYYYYVTGDYSYNRSLYWSFSNTHTTSGSFSGPSLKAATDAANTAATNASNAYTAANNAYGQLTNSTYGLSAIKSKVDSTYIVANNAATYTWDSAESKSAATLAKEARDKANQALTEINNVKSMVTSIQSSVGPQIVRVRGLNGATATRTTSFTVTVEAANASQWRAKLGSSGTWSAWTPVSSSITLSGLSSTGAYTIYVEVQSASGATATGQMIAFRL